MNNVPGVFTQFNTPLYPIESLELISGPNVGIYGTGVQYETTNPGGIVSVKSKVAPDKGIFDYTQTISGRGLFGEYLDWGQRFGDKKEWGVRIMTETSTAVHPSKARRLTDRAFLPISTGLRKIKRQFIYRIQKYGYPARSSVVYPEQRC